MAEVIAPRHPGVFAASGLLMTDLRHTPQLVHRRPLACIDAGELCGQGHGAARASSRRSLLLDGIEPVARRHRLARDPLATSASSMSSKLALAMPCEAERRESGSIAARFDQAHRILPMVMGNPRR